MPFDGYESITPYSFPKYLWEKMQPSLRRFNARFAPATPDDQLLENAIVWTIESRSPGDDKGHGGGGAIRPAFDKRLVDENGEVKDLYTQTYTIVYRFELFSDSVDQLHDMAWEFEKAFESVTDAMTSDGYGDIVTSFLAQSDPKLRNSYGNSNLRYVTLKFKVILPVQMLVTSMKIQRITTKINLMRRYKTNTYTLSDTNPFEISPEVGFKVDSIDEVKYQAPGSYVGSHLTTEDYTPTYENNNGLLTWSNSFLPAVGGKLVITHTLIPLVNSSFDTA